ncbi:unnamed protein product [Allacma fusca]|uniref:Transmembrane protein n=1 Tax=Allacma fusca TaxID=39272 RepID=A0A8J2NXY1_9HEXA|nr:unnamed protein product [Allacma fusca]
MLGLEGYAFSYNRFRFFEPIDVTFLTFVPLFLALSIGWLLVLTCIKQRSSNLVRILRLLQGIILLIIGLLMVVSERSIAKSRVCHGYEHMSLQSCQLSVPKFLAGILTILDGILYFLRPHKRILEGENQSLVQRGNPVPIEAQIPFAIRVEIATDPTGGVVDGAGGAYQPLTSKPSIGFNQQYQQPFSNVPLRPNQYYENPPSYFEVINPPQNPLGQQAENPQFYNYPSGNYGTSNQTDPGVPHRYN